MKPNNIITCISVILHTIVFSKNPSVENSWLALLDKHDEQIHATYHINNIIRNGLPPNQQKRIDLLEDLGIKIHKNKLITSQISTLDNTYDSEHFLFHYTLDQSNTNSISSEDLNNNNIPDYIELMSTTFESVWVFFEDSLGFTPPPPDGSNGGSNKYDIYIKNLNSNYFGITWTTNFISNSNTRCNSYIEMRNNYDASVFQGLTESENVKITAVHEFFHAIQFSYNCYEEFWLMEATAVWSEDELYNDINDHYRYMGNWFSRPYASINEETSHMYGSFIFFQYIDEHLGGPESIRRIWENSKNNASSVNDISFSSIENALQSVGSSLTEALNSMSIANRIMTNHSNADPYTYEEANEYPVTVPATISSFSFNYNDQINFNQNSLKLYASHYYNFDITSPIRIVINKSTGSIDDIFSSVIYKYKDQNKWQIDKGHDFNIDPNLNLDWISLLVTASKNTNNDLDYSINLSDGYALYINSNSIHIFPNPISLINNNLKIKVISAYEQNLKIEIYNLLGQNLKSFNDNIPGNGEKVILWNGKNKLNKNISNGVYIIKLNAGNSTIIKKLTVLNSSN